MFGAVVIAFASFIFCLSIWWLGTKRLGGSLLLLLPIVFVVVGFIVLIVFKLIMFDGNG